MNLTSLFPGLGGAQPSAPAPVTGRAVAMRGVSHPVFAALRTHPAAIAARGGSPLRAGRPGISSRQPLGGGSDAVTSATPDGYATGGVDDGAPTAPPADPGIFPLPTPSPSAFQQALQQRIPQANAQVSIGPAQEKKGLTDSQKKALILGLGAAALGVGYLVYQQGRK